MSEITVIRGKHEDASQAAKRAADVAGVTIAGNLRWYGAANPYCREVATSDGGTIRVLEPDFKVTE